MSWTLGFIGTGFMGTALIKGVINSGKIAPERIYLYDIDTSKAEKLASETGANPARSNLEAAEKSDVVLLAVKPGMVKTALEPVKDMLAGKLLISIAVGVPVKTYRDILGEKSRVIRVMPNTPAMVGEGMTLICSDGSATAEDIEKAMAIFGSVGKAEMLEEKLMNEVTALTSSSPAYVFMFIEAMADAAVLSGIPRNLSYKLAAQAVLGSAKMVLETGKHPGELKDQVCSPAGTTIEAVAALEKNGFRFAVLDAMNECTKRAREIGKK